MNKYLFIFLSLILSTSAFAELGGAHAGRAHDVYPAQVSEKEYRCLNARRSLENIFSEEADHFNQPFIELRDAIQAYKKLDCVYTAGFLFSTPQQVEKYFRYKARAKGSRMPASL